MPLYKTITTPNNSKVLIWKIEESYEELLQGIQLTDNCRTRVASMKSEIHQRGFLSVRHLLKKAGYKASDLFYNSSGKPHLKDGKHISITHSFTFAAIIVSDGVIGIDIEKQRDKIGVIAHKFIDYEFNYLSSDQVRELTVVWCVKESLYKAFATDGMSFKQHTKVIPFEIGEQETTGWIIYNDQLEKYEIKFLEFEGFTCAYAIKSEI
ncbi:4'-phosphopantetheinyl transferase superfamily protein [Zhouia spongiae]|uniref:4'-phosphopantetheinyl transferase superfamily protein n=1 Tax=Zhouia spongiae TaxID=2202721 RepID=A0ABY3YRN4_9FLAO|nr:4'-phosphopantetheinyl transferase superfamily protein [Zhouia spongiae]UNY99528.1 4'-phosphopantetheinyl transferase superfamily protein [Zhouia spongiae]